ncbi:TPA: DNA recombination protein RmuC [Streptococcus suis]|uniref:DNA recombination protein RmuC n=1 Tax=Streptococcus TaxID=1301 RepID=UPI001C8ECAF1|nr:MULTISPECIES: DNA recombination protein RmuC [Streptococcus]MBY0719115.1 DNA recombination protein RmuC [Streptococcus sp. 2018110]MCO8207217.1 DNA recombination protein RmuC [Streptococcus suis]MCO8211496.1 DNA recombination protein RmuC [Streptococcus suis]MCO8234556.1 DNA recombination protein RmuC [Streptococcus suis]HEM3492555.1 DNA recombination protein RmuC [Streptococcus suis]
MDIVLLILLILVLIALVFLYGKWQSLALLLQDQAEDTADNLSDQLSYQLENATLKQQQAIHQEVERLRTELYQQLTDIRQELNKSHLETRDATDRRLQAIQESNEKRLEEMRQTVEEKLEKTLQTRLQASFETVSKQLESVNRGLGEMQTVARDVGSLNKVLSGTKTRGIMGELQLGQIIEDILTPSQYEREFATVSGSSERVEYAVKLPGRTEGDYIYLPIDSKFPLADYYRLEDAYESGDKDQIDLHRKNLLAAIKRFAKDIQNKYLNPPETTNFGVLFLPTEGLYSEVVRNPIFFDDLRRQENIVVAGPTTLSALLNSLSVGFKTLNIQRSADDISKVLGNVKLEFGKFSDLLLKAQKQLNQASSNIDKLLTTRTNAIERSLRTIDLYEDDQTKGLLGLSPLDEEDNEN